MVSPERLDSLQIAFARLLAEFGVEPAVAYPHFDHLVAMHSQSHRHYHNLEHIAEVLKVAGRLRQFADNPNAVQLAVWYHDAIYDPKQRDNEAKSADFARNVLEQLGVSSPMIASATDLILATAHGTPHELTTDVRVLLDADLAILGSGETRYLRYAADIRREYAWVPDAEYATARIAVLDGFLARQRIFHTDVMFLEGEGSARRNMLAERAKLISLVL